jgi:hypothetical protein
LFSCLNDAELGFLGAPWPRYYEMATKNNIEILRLPMLEGSCPHTIEEIDIVIDLVTEKMRNGENVLTHCRGGKLTNAIYKFVCPEIFGKGVS